MKTSNVTTTFFGNLAMVIAVLMSVSCTGGLKSKVESLGAWDEKGVRTLAATEGECMRLHNAFCYESDCSDIWNVLVCTDYWPKEPLKDNCLPDHTHLPSNGCTFDPHVSIVNLRVEGPGQVYVRSPSGSKTWENESGPHRFHGSFDYGSLTTSPGSYSLMARPNSGATVKFSGDCVADAYNNFSHEGNLRGIEHNCTITFFADTAPPVDVRLNVTVKEKTTFVRLEDALVTVAGNRDCSTDSFGFCSQLVPSGSQPLRVSKTGYKTHTQTLSLVRSESIEVYLEPDSAPPPPESRLTIIVSDSTSGQRIAGARVNLGFGDYYADSQGVLSGNIRHGSYSGTASKAGYHDKPVSVTVNGPDTLDISLTPIAHSQRSCTDELGGTRAHGDEWSKNLQPRRENFSCAPGESGAPVRVTPLQQPMICNDGSPDPNGSIIEGTPTVEGKCTPDSGSTRSCGTTAHGDLETTYDDSTLSWENCPAGYNGSRSVFFRVTIVRLCTDGNFSEPSRSQPVLHVVTNNCVATQPPPPPPTHGFLSLCFIMGDGSPIEGVTVKTISGPFSGSDTTNAAGCVGADIPFGVYSFQASKGGASISGTITHDRHGRVLTYNAATGQVTSN